MNSPSRDHDQTASDGDGPLPVPPSAWVLEQATKLSSAKDHDSIGALAWNLTVAFSRWSRDGMGRAPSPPLNADAVPGTNTETVLLEENARLRDAVKPLAALAEKISPRAKDDDCWCGQDGAVIRYRDIRRASEAYALSKDPALALVRAVVEAVEGKGEP